MQTQEESTTKICFALKIFQRAKLITAGRGLMGPLGVLCRRSTWHGGGFHKGRTDSTYRASASNGLLRGVPPLHNKDAGIVLSSSTLISIAYMIILEWYKEIQRGTKAFNS